MGSGTNANQIARGRLRDENVRLLEQKEELIQQLALERSNARNASIIIGCLVKRLGQLLADDRGWRVLVTDEEFEALDGELEVHRSEPVNGIILTLKAKPKSSEEEISMSGDEERT